MKTLLFMAALLLLLGPFRRPYLRHGRYTLPATVGGVLGLCIGRFVGCKAGLSPPLTALLAIAMSVGLANSFGHAFKNWHDRTFGEKRDNRDR